MREKKIEPIFFLRKKSLHFVRWSLFENLVPLIFLNRPFPSLDFSHTHTLDGCFEWLKTHQRVDIHQEGKNVCVGAVICSVESICYRFICAALVLLLWLPLLNTFHSCNPICYSTPIIGSFGVKKKHTQERPKTQ